MRVVSVIKSAAVASVAASALVLSGCGGDTGNGSAPVTSATAVPKAAAPAGKTWEQVVAKTEHGYLMGNPNAPIKLVEYGSRGCPVCGAFANTGMRPLVEKYVNTGQVSLEFREFWVHGAPDVAASLVGNCVGTEAYFPILEQMYANQEALNGRLQALPPQVQQQLESLPPAQAPAAWAEAAGYIDFIKQRGVPEAKARQCLADQKLVGDLTKSFQHGQQEMKVQGTPTFFINGTQVQNTVRWQELEPALQAAGAR